MVNNNDEGQTGRIVKISSFVCPAVISLCFCFKDVKIAWQKSSITTYLRIMPCGVNGDNESTVKEVDSAKLIAYKKMKFRGNKKLGCWRYYW